ncbi:metallophosphoesterase family protein [Pedobacter sp.]|uniref:metallophosphoesterase family protein n=1 Tax=Pedobacter sp. TaxID=1411316 RepID=UPI003D7FB38E
MRNRITVIIPILLLMIMGCGGFEYSPNQYFSGDTPRDINQRNIKRLQEEQGDARIRFILTGDSQRSYKDAEDLVKVINQIPEIDFVLLAGDISDFGLSQEMEWVDKVFSKLQRPYLGVIGNHDLVATGEKAFKRMYGELNYSFVYQGVKFVCHNTNSRETSFSGNVPDLEWLKKEFSPETGVEAYIAVAHVPPGDGDFDRSLEAKYINIINTSPNTLAALYAHQHAYNLFYPGNQHTIPYIVTTGIEKRKFVLIEILNGKLTFENIEY